MMKTYASKDFYLGSFLIANDCELLETIVNNGVTTFVFEMNEQVKKLVGNYYSLKSKVEPMAYGQAIRTLKSVIHASKSNSKPIYNNERTELCTSY